MRKIIGLVGLIGSGKGTAGDYLIKEHGFVSASFASTLKDAVSSIFGWPRDLLEGDTPSSRSWREIPDDYWSSKLGKPVTPRWVLQYIGTDVMRNHFSDNIWILSLEKKIASSDNSTVITDVRFPNEVELIKNLGGKLVWVRRNPEPHWLETAIANKDILRADNRIHPSEYEWIGEHDYTVLWNTGSLESFYQKIDGIVSE
jgi:hypothetical protein